MNLCPHSGRLGAYHDNQLPPDQQARMQRHLEG
jgi:hypothetical protein